MHNDLKRLQGELERALSGLDDRQTQLRPESGLQASPRGWNVQQIIGHLLLTYAATLAAVEARLARWLLRVRDLAGSDRFTLTQELMAQMIGARRNSVSIVAHTLQQEKYIRYSRGHVEILDLEGLRGIGLRMLYSRQGSV